MTKKTLLPKAPIIMQKNKIIIKKLKKKQDNNQNGILNFKHV